MNSITAIIVSYNTADLLRDCYESIRKFYPILKVIIIDGSMKDSACWQYSKSINGGSTLVKNVEYNIGHGHGMKMGISMCQSDYFLLIDSDVTINAPGCIEEMGRMIKQNKICFGVGQVIQVNDSGGNVQKGLPYLHPHFALINKKKYLICRPFINHGAPCIHTMIDVFVYNWFLCGMNLTGYITHKGRGTRELNPPEFNPGNWDKI